MINSTTATNAEAIDPNSEQHNSLANPQTSKTLYAHFRNNCIRLVAADRSTNFHFNTYNKNVNSVKIKTKLLRSILLPQKAKLCILKGSYWNPLKPCFL